MEEEVDRKEEQIKRNEAEIASCRDDIRSKVEQVFTLFCSFCETEAEPWV
jgi:hypothetical protein